MKVQINHGNQLDERDWSDGVYILGRSHNCDWMIPEISVSSRHLELTIKAGTVSFVDLNSSNGTKLNGKKVSSGELSATDVLQLGNVELRCPDILTIIAPNPVDAGEETPSYNPIVKEQIKPLYNDERPAAMLMPKTSSKPTGKANNKTLAIRIGAIVLAVIAVILLLLPASAPSKPVDNNKPETSYNINSYWQDVEKGCQQFNRITPGTEEMLSVAKLWQEAHQKYAAVKPSTMRMPETALVMEKIAKSLSNVTEIRKANWLNYEQSLQTILSEAEAAAYPAIETFLENIIRRCRSEARAVNFLSQAEQALAINDPKVLRESVTQLPRDSALVAMGNKLLQTWQEREFTTKSTAAHQAATNRNWKQAIIHGREALALENTDSAVSDKLRQEVTNWEKNLAQNERLDLLIQGFANTAPEESQQIIQEAERILEQEGDSLSIDVKTKITSAIREAKQNILLTRLRRAYIAGDTAVLDEERKKLTLNSPEEAHEIIRRFDRVVNLQERAKKAETSHDYINIRDAWEAVSETAGKSAFKDDADSKLVQWSKERIGRLLKDEGVKALDSNKIKLAREKLAAAKSYGAEVDDIVAGMQKRGRTLASQGKTDIMNKHILSGVSKLETALEYFLPDEKYYQEITEELRKY